jgi:hypothetical protein
VSTSPREWSALLALFLVALWTVPLAAASGRVAIVNDAAENPALAEALIRIRGELAAEGFDVVLWERAQGEAPLTLAAVAERADALAAIGLTYDADEGEVVLRVVDRLTSKTLVRRAPLAGDNGSGAAEVLAVRAVDLLRASLLELLTTPRAVPATVAPALETQQAQASSFARRALPSEPSRDFCAEAGMGMLTSLSGIGPAFMPVARVQHVLVRPLRLRLGVAGLGTEPRVTSTRASARVSQDTAELELLVTAWSGRDLSLSGSIGGGLLHTGVDGQAEWPYRARQSGLWSALLDLGAGLGLTLSSRFDLIFETHALVAEPHPVVRFIAEERARSGFPSLFETLTVAGWL